MIYTKNHLRFNPGQALSTLRIPSEEAIAQDPNPNMWQTVHTITVRELSSQSLQVTV